MAVNFGIGFCLNIGFRPQSVRIQAVETRSVTVTAIYNRVFV